MAYVSKHVFTDKQIRYIKIKRILDILLALILLIPALIIMLVFAIWIKLESKGPAIFKQRRPGFHQKIFTLYKLRSMRVETRDKNGRELTDQERMTLSGKVARKTSIDELPQIWNILKGDMSFIGPRPFLINDLDSYNEEQLVRFDVLPGITSWTAIHGRNNQTIQEKYDQEIYYVNHISFATDLQIFFKTIGLVLSQKDVEDHVTEGRIAAQIIEDDK